VKIILFGILGGVFLTGTCCAGLLVFGYLSHEDTLPAPVEMTASARALAADDAEDEESELQQASAQMEGEPAGGAGVKRPDGDTKAQLLGEWVDYDLSWCRKQNCDPLVFTQQTIREMALGKQRMNFTMASWHAFRDDGTCEYNRLGHSGMKCNSVMPTWEAFSADSCTYQVTGNRVHIRTVGSYSQFQCDASQKVTPGYVIDKTYQASFGFKWGNFRATLTGSNGGMLSLSRKK
jgi:hypothetical protein